MGIWFSLYKNWVILGSALLIGGGVWAGYIPWGDQGKSGSEWETVNRQMGALLASADPAAGAVSKGAGYPVNGGTPAAATEATAMSTAPVPLAAPASSTPSTAPAAASITPGEASSPAKPAIDPRIDINTASAASLTELPGIGDSKAKAIVAYREANGPFRSVEAIMNVKGIGPKTFEALKDRIRVSNNP